MITANLHVTVAGELVTIRPIWQRCEGEGLECPQEVFTQHEEANNADFGAIVRAVDWERVRFPVLHSGRSASIAAISMRLMKRAIERGNLASSMESSDPGVHKVQVRAPPLK